MSTSHASLDHYFQIIEDLSNRLLELSSAFNDIYSDVASQQEDVDIAFEEIVVPEAFSDLRESLASIRSLSRDAIVSLESSERSIAGVLVRLQDLRRKVEKRVEALRNTQAYARWRREHYVGEEQN